MANPSTRLEQNAAGDFFVDSTCIDCATCRWVAPASFDQIPGYSRVYRQPRTAEETRRALMAMVACPTGSIGKTEPHDMRPARDAFPEPIDGPVHHCGYHHENSFGAASYLIVRPEGNVLVDSPRFSRPLVRRLEELGGVRQLFLTHQDDVADHRKFHDHFGCERILHRDDVRSGTRSVEIQIDGTDPVELAHDLTVIPVPGHTRGSACLLFGHRYLFSGDHVAWSPRLEQVYAFRSACWYDWDVQIESMDRLRSEHTFEWILPGHGFRCHFERAAMRGEMERCIAWMRARA